MVTVIKDATRGKCLRDYQRLPELPKITGLFLPRIPRLSVGFQDY